MGGGAHYMVNDGKKESTLVPIIVRLSAAAAPDMASIEQESNSPPWSEKLFADELVQKHSLSFGARVGGALVGFLVVHVTWDDAHIVNFGVRKQFRGHGIGRALIEYVLHELHTRAVRWVTLEVRKTNQAALGLYQSCGFSEVGVREKYYRDNQEDALVLSLNLAQWVANYEASVIANQQAVNVANG